MGDVIETFEPEREANSTLSWGVQLGLKGVVLTKVIILGQMVVAEGRGRLERPKDCEILCIRLKCLQLVTDTVPKIQRCHVCALDKQRSRRICVDGDLESWGRGWGVCWGWC